jgi:hypothetical protein
MINKAKAGDVLYTLNYNRESEEDDYDAKNWSIIKFVVARDFDNTVISCCYIWSEDSRPYHPGEVYRTLKNAKKALEVATKDSALIRTLEGVKNERNY